MSNPRNMPDVIESSESDRPLTRGVKTITLSFNGQDFTYPQPGWWASIDDPNDMEGELVDEDNIVAGIAARTFKAASKGEKVFFPDVIKAIRLQCGLSQREAGLVFGGGDKAFEKYERGDIRPSEPTKRLLRLASEYPNLFKKPPRGKFVFPTASEAAAVQKASMDATMSSIYERLAQTNSKLQDDMPSKSRAKENAA